MSSHLDDLQDWLSHPGTKLFYDHLDQEWGTGGLRFEASVNKFADSLQDDPIVLQQIRQIVVCRREMLRLKAWAGEEVARLKRLDEKPENVSGRPALPQELQAFTRGGR